MRNAFEKIIQALKEKKHKQKAQKNSITNLHLMIQRIFYQN